MDIYNIHDRICAAYFKKLEPHFSTKHGLSTTDRENALVTLSLYEQIGVLSEIGLLQLQNVRGDKTGTASKNAVVVADTLVRLIQGNPSSGSPRLDGNAIEISMAMFLLYATGRHDAAKSWLEELTSRMSFAFAVKRYFPVSTDSFEDVLALEIGTLPEEEVQTLRELSTLVPTLAYWSIAFEHESLYEGLCQLQNTSFKEVCLQLWFPDEKSDSMMYRKMAQYDSGLTEAPIVFPALMSTLIDAEKLKIQSGTLVGPDKISAIRYNLPILLMMATRHYRTPFPPQLWMLLVTMLRARAGDDGGKGDES